MCLVLLERRAPTFRSCAVIQYKGTEQFFLLFYLLVVGNLSFLWQKLSYMR